MSHFLYEIDAPDLDSLNPTIKKQAISSLESGKIVFFPKYTFALNQQEQHLLSPSIIDPKEKNISYDYQHQRLNGVAKDEDAHTMLTMMHRFAEFAKHAVTTTMPEYSDTIRWGRTSYRPTEIKGRKTSKRKDDTRLHVDSFSASPVYGLRILRVFCNINPNAAPRVWHVGEPFPDLLAAFSPRIPNYSPTLARLLKLVKTTKTLRSPYDHYMINLHDRMKSDDVYQQNVSKQRFDFPPHSTWFVFTDHVSHAALSGQFLLEQTFYLPVDSMEQPEHSPLRQWEKEKRCALV